MEYEFYLLCYELFKISKVIIFSSTKNDHFLELSFKIFFKRLITSSLEIHTLIQGLFISDISSNNNNSSSKASLDLISHPLGWQFQFGIYLTNFQVKTNQIFFFPASHCQANFENIMHQFAIHFSSMEFEFNSSCMQSHSIFSFKWNLIFTKSIHYFH